MKSRGSSRYFSLMKALVFMCALGLLPWGVVGAEETRPVWPPPPDPARVEFLGELELRDLHPERGIFGKLARVLGGKSENEELGLPFDVIRVADRFYLTCQNIPALVEVLPEKGSFRLYTCDTLPLVYPIGLCRMGDSVLLTDSERGAVYRFRDGRLTPFITEGLVRPTGIAVVGDRLFVVDTRVHTIHIFDFEGNPKGTVGHLDEHGLHFPTFAAAAGEDLLVNDSLNYRIRRFDGEGTEILAFGREGNGPGSFARPKDLAVDTDGHVYIVDTLFDNIQVFDREGRLLLVIGGQGSGAGEFWSPSGIDIVEDTLYVADTFNHRIQILRYLGDI